MNYRALEEVINHELRVHEFVDYAPNGLQVEGRHHVGKIITGVTACQALLDKAVEMEADAVLVHHGYFWKNERTVIQGMMRRRLATLLRHDINLYAYHLPLDAHPTLGNNAQLGLLMGIHIEGSTDTYCMYGEFDKPLPADEVASRLKFRIGNLLLHCGDNGPRRIQKVAWCTGGGQDYILQAAEKGVDAFISGEMSEKTIHIAREMGLHFFAAGHHATERYGIKALGEWLHTTHKLDVTFVDIPNPA
ncbi:MAG: Nif3-like dinuclear metal center hexameric protein [Enterobacteriaceae bacterium]